MNCSIVFRLSCSLRQSLINSSRTPTDLEAQRNIVLQDIRNSLCVQARVATPSTSCQLRIATCGAPTWVYISSDKRIIELDFVDIRANYSFFSPQDRGLYDYTNGKILLSLGKWCRETLIHEVLHSVSFPCVRRDLGRRYNLIFEGMTELFTGYVMFRHYSDCHNAWKEKQYQECSATYEPYIRLWASFCRFIPMPELLKVYFWDGTRDWEGKYSSFLRAIHQAGYPNFGDFRRRPTPTVETKILEECLRNFGRTKFKRIYEYPLGDILDFTQMLCP